MVALAGWLGIPDGNKIKPGNVAVAQGGTWSSGTGASWGVKSTSAGSTITITNLYGPAILIAMMHWENGGTAGSYRIDVDGVPVLTNSAQFPAPISQSGWPVSYAPWGILLTNLDWATHTLVITALSGTVEWDWAAGNLLTMASIGGPNVYLCPTTVRSRSDIYTTGWDAASDTFDVRRNRVNWICYRDVATRLAQAGLNVCWCDLSETINPGTDLQSDGVHPNTGGHQNMALAVERLMNGINLPRHKQLALYGQGSSGGSGGTNLTQIVNVLPNSMIGVDGTNYSITISNGQWVITAPLIVNAGLVAQWTLNNTLADSVNGYNLTGETSPAYTNANTALMLNGGGAAYVQNINLDNVFKGTNSWSVSLWFRANATNAIPASGWRLVSDSIWANSPSDLCDIWLAPNGANAQLGWNIYGDGAQMGNFIGVNIQANTTYHLVLTRSGTSLKYYINGALAQTVTGPVTINNYAPINYFYIGKQYGLTTSQINGWIDDVRVFNVTLSPAVVSLIYSNGLQ